MSRKYQSRTDLEELQKRSAPRKNQWRELTMKHVFTTPGNYKAVLWNNNVKMTIANEENGTEIFIHTASARFRKRFIEQKRRIFLGVAFYESNSYVFQQADLPALIMYLQAHGGLRRIRAAP